MALIRQPLEPAARNWPAAGRAVLLAIALSVVLVVVTVITAGLALLLLGASEYGARIFPPRWGILAVLPAAAGILAVVLLRRRRAYRGTGS